LFFDDDGRVYMLHGGGDLRLTELMDDVSGLKPGGFNEVVVKDATGVAGPNRGLNAEGPKCSNMRENTISSTSLGLVVA
jgi:beta-xylosidase